LSNSPPSTSAADPLIGRVVGAYLIKGVLGVGGMGTVYQAAGPYGERVALKLIKGDLARDDVFRRRFAREARIARRVQHPHIVPVLDTGEYEGRPYLVQRLIEAGTLAGKIKEQGKMDVETTVRVCRQITPGLDALHVAGLIHRDMKPANILLDQQGKAYITDFGLAKDSQGSVLTRPGQALGSVDYMAPEQIRSEDVSAATDVYALGCVVYECLCGAPPFADRQGMRVLWAHLQDPPVNPRVKRPDLSPEFGAAIMRALEKNPSQRPQSATEFARELETAL
jgi:serine/threonine protein kinase